MNNCEYCHTIDSITGGFIWHCMYADRVCLGDVCEKYDDSDVE